MVSNYRQTSLNANKQVSSGGTSVFKIDPLATEQTPTGRLAKLKVSIIPSAESSDCSYLIHASSSSGSAVSDIITAQAVPNGGGTVWLTVKRAIRDGDAQEDRNDGPVFVWVRSSNPSSTTDIILEAWGRFIDIDTI